MVKHVIKLSGIQEEIPTIIAWSLVVEGNALRLVGDDGFGERKVITIYPSGVSYRHHNATLIGLDVDAKGRVKEYSTPLAAHKGGGTR